MTSETKIEERLRTVVELIAPNQTARYDLLSSRTAISRHKWVNWLNRRQSLSVEMLEAFLVGWPESAIWVATGSGAEPSSRIDELDAVRLSRDDAGRAMANIPHAVSQYGKGTPPAFEWGHDGSGPRELGMNILFHFGIDAPVADFFARHFVANFLHELPEDGGVIEVGKIKEWLAEMDDEIRRKTEEYRRLEELKRTHEEQVRQAMESFNAGKG